MKNSKFILTTPLSISECINRLNESTDKSLFTVFGNKPLSGKITGTKIKISKRINYQNGMQPLLVASFKEKNGETVLEGKFRMHLLSKMFLLFVIIFTLLMEILIYSSISELSAIMLILLLFLIAIVIAGKYLARNHQKFIRQYISELFDTDN
jgi:hypothetical protein